MSKSTYIEFALVVRVLDEAAVRQAARDQAIKDRLDQHDADEYLSEDVYDLPACARMLLDPGHNPPGLMIVDSVAGAAEDLSIAN